LVDVLSRAAREQKVDLITANSDSETISNYDYIALAAINFNEHNRLGKVDIRLPPCTIRPGYSRFQGSGIDSRILADLSKS
jgi:hypothetical protein